MHQGLAVIEEEGLRNRWERHQQVGAFFVDGISKLGFTPLVKDPANRLWHLSVLTPPSHINEAVLRERLLQNYGIEIAGGLGKLAGKILRIGTMGPLATKDQAQFLLASIQASL